MPLAWAWRGSLNERSAPSSRMTPLSGTTRPVSTLTSVLLPAPFSPQIALISPACRSSATLFSACTLPNRLHNPSMRRSGSGGVARLSCEGPKDIATLAAGAVSFRSRFLIRTGASRLRDVGLRHDAVLLEVVLLDLFAGEHFLQHLGRPACRDLGQHLHGGSHVPGR